MATLSEKKGKKGITYFIVYRFKEHQKDGLIKNKKKWVRIGNNKREAQQALRDFNREYDQNKNQFNKMECSLFSDFVHQEFLPWCKVRKSDDSYIETKRSLEIIGNYFGSVSLEEIKVKGIERYITWRKQPKVNGKVVSNRTVNKDLIYLSQCLKKAKEWRFITENACEHVAKLKENKGRIRFFSKEEICRLLEHANNYIVRYLAVGLSTGMRANEDPVPPHYSF